ncbi:MAG: signal peptidase I [Gammaproteobacteria bacterium]
MIWDFSAILFFATLASGVIWLIDTKFYKQKRLAGNPSAKEPMIVDYSRSFFPILLFVFLLRSFLVEPYRIPSGSMEPTLLVGDFIVVNKFTYGIRLPILNKKVIAINEPKLGDVMVFRYPPDPKVNFIKRVIGLPGDKIVYQNKELFINGQHVKKELLGTETHISDNNETYAMRLYLEKLPNANHDIYEHVGPGQGVSLTVPPGHYFVMGDNRDESDDSRFWGFVPEENIIGRAFGLWMSWDADNYRVRFDRIGNTIH